MKLSKIKNIKPLGDLVAFKWLRPETFTKSGLYIPENIHEGGGQGRLGHRYSCEVIAIGPKVHGLKPGERFLLHEYDKEDQATPWNENDIMFVKEMAVKIKYTGKGTYFDPAKEITDKMMDEYEDY